MPNKKPQETVSADDILGKEVPEALNGPLESTVIKYKGMYDLDGLYHFMTNWLRQKRFEIHESIYKYRAP